MATAKSASNKGQVAVNVAKTLVGRPWAAAVIFIVGLLVGVIWF